MPMPNSRTALLSDDSTVPDRSPDTGTGTKGMRLEHAENNSEAINEILDTKVISTSLSDKLSIRRRCKLDITSV
jgi:hypothetical protein